MDTKNTNIFISVGLVIVLAVAVTLYLSSQQKETTTSESLESAVVQEDTETTGQLEPAEETEQTEINMQDNTEEVVETQEVADENPATNEIPGQYVEYYDGIIQATSGEKVLFFHADWCIQCRRLEDDITAQGVPSGVTIIEVDFDNSQDLRSKYSVNQQTTLVRVGNTGEELAKYSAYSSPDFQSVLSGLNLL